MASFDNSKGSWRYRVRYKDSDGVWRTKSRQGFRTKKEAADAALSVEQMIGNGDPLSNEPTLAEYWHEWVKVYKQGKKAKSTEARYPIIEKTLKDEFPNIKLTDITPRNWQTFLNTYAENHARRSVSLINSYVRSMVAAAINDGVIHRDFTYGAEISGTASKKESLKYLQAHEFERLIDLSRNHASASHIGSLAVYVGAETGMRVSEVLGLTYQDIDQKAGVLHVTNTWDYNYGHEFKATKTAASIRDVEVNPAVFDKLKEIWEQQGQPPATWSIFRTSRGSVATDAGCNAALRKLETRLRIPTSHQITFHGLRHTHVSYLLSHGVDIYYISKRLGHANITITMNVYSHLLDTQRKKQAKLAMKALQRPDTKRVLKTV